MIWQEAMLSRLLAAPAVTALIGDRATWMTRPQKDQLPAIVLQQLPSDRPVHMEGFQAFRSTFVQLDAWALTPLAAITLYEAAIAALAPAADAGDIRFDRSFITAERDGFEQAGPILLHRKSADLAVWHSPIS